MIFSSGAARAAPPQRPHPRLEADLAGGRRSPAMVADVLARTETAAPGKAFLLAADQEIKAPTIIRQITATGV